LRGRLYCQEGVTILGRFWQDVRVGNHAVEIADWAVLLNRSEYTVLV